MADDREEVVVDLDDRELLNSTPVDPKSIPDRLVVIERIYFQVMPHEEAAMIDGRFTRNLKSKDEQLYSRKCKAIEEWSRLDVGWIDPDHVGMLHIKNEAERRQGNPTPEQQAEDASRVLELKFVGASDEERWVILPGESFRGQPNSATRLVVRCRHGSTKFTITAIPA